MSYLVRKIERSRWNGSDVENGRIKAEVVAHCIRPFKSGLSVWYAQDYKDIEQAKLALLAAMNKIATIDLIIIPEEQIMAAGLRLAATPAENGENRFKHLHRDICDLDLDSLKVIAKIIQTYIATDKIERLTLLTCKNILTTAIKNQLLDVHDLDPGIAKKLTAQ